MTVRNTLNNSTEIKLAQNSQLEINGITIRFQLQAGELAALEDVSLAFPRDSFISLIGPSGCGKSTLLRAIADLQKLTLGRISIFGSSPSEARQRREIGFVFQDATLLPWRTVEANVGLPLTIGGRRADRTTETKTRDAMEVLDLVGLADRKDAYPHQLSGGMRQRVAIARALIQAPSILLMDEPFGALDEITRDRLNDQLLDIWSKTNVTVVFVTHSIQEAVYLSNKVVVMAARPGRVHETIDIHAPYPRSSEFRDSPEFADISKHLRRSLQEGTQ